MYADARLPRPPGPFSWQLTEFLQRNLVCSARLAQRWTSQPVKVLSVPTRCNEECKLLCGRWLIIMKRDHVVSRDINTRSEQVLFERHSFHIAWDVTCCMVSDRGHLLYLGIHWKDHPVYPEGQRLHVLAFSMHAV